MAITDLALESYDRQPTIAHPEDSPTSQRETTAFSYFGVIGAEDNVINETLGNIAELDERISHLRRLITRSTVQGKEVLVPPDPNKHPVMTGSGNGMLEKPVVDRLLATMLLLTMCFGVDSNQLLDPPIINGPLGGKQMRKVSYNLLNVTLNHNDNPEDKTLLVCDEIGNVSFVFDTSKLIEEGIEPSELMTLTKQDLKDLIKSDQSLGTTVQGGEFFINKITRALNGDHPAPLRPLAPRCSPLHHRLQAAKVLDEMPPGGIRIKDFANAVGVSTESVARIVEGLDPHKLGQLYRIKVPQRTSRYPTILLPDQQVLVTDALTVKGMPPKGVTCSHKTIRELVAQFPGLTPGTIRAALDKLSEVIGPIQTIMGKNRRERSFTPTQQQLIIGALGGEKSLSGRLSPDDGYQTFSAMARRVGVTFATIARAVNTINDRLGPIPVARTSRENIPRQVLDPRQQQLIIDFLSTRPNTRKKFS